MKAKYICFFDCHVDGVSQVFTRAQMWERIIDACKETHLRDAVVVLGGDNFDIKNSLDRQMTISFNVEIFKYVRKNAKRYFIFDGNHDDVYGKEENQFSCDITTLLHHGYVSKYGKPSKPTLKQIGVVFRSIKYVGVLYRKVFPWKLKDKSKKYLSAYLRSTHPQAMLSISGHEHPAEIQTFQEDGRTYYVCPQGMSVVYDGQ